MPLDGKQKRGSDFQTPKAKRQCAGSNKMKMNGMYCETLLL